MLTCSVGGEGCGAQFAAENADKHNRRECPRRIVRCECGTELRDFEMGDHKILECDAFLRYCSLGCGAKLRQMDMKAHQETECPKRHLKLGERVACPLGCGKNDMRFHESFTHIATECPRRTVECALGCGACVPAQAANDHHQTCRYRVIECGAGSIACKRQLRSWLGAQSGELGAKCEVVVCEEHQSTPLIRAVRLEELALVEYLCDICGNDLNMIEHEANDGHTAVTAACAIGFTKGLSALELRGVDLNHETKRGRTALVEAAKAGELEVVRWLIEHGVTMQYVTRQSATAFDWAAMSGEHEVLTQLVRDYRVQTEMRRLFIAITRGDNGTVEEIVKAGEKYRVNHVAVLEQELLEMEGIRDEGYGIVGELEADVNVRRPKLAEMRKALVEHMAATLEIDATSDRRRAEYVRRAERMHLPLRQAIVTFQSLQPAHVQEVRALGGAGSSGAGVPVEELRVLIAVCVLFGKEAVEVPDRYRPLKPPARNWWLTARELLGGLQAGYLAGLAGLYKEFLKS